MTETKKQPQLTEGFNGFRKDITRQEAAHLLRRHRDVYYRYPTLNSRPYRIGAGYYGIGLFSIVVY